MNVCVCALYMILTVNTKQKPIGDTHKIMQKRCMRNSVEIH